MADYTEIDAAQALYKAGIGQDFMTIVRDNFINHQDRLIALEGQAIFAVHFNFEDVSSATDAGLPPGDLWITGKAGSSTYRRDSFSSFTLRCVSAGDITLRSQFSLQFDTVGKPILFSSRQKLSADGGFKIGMGLLGSALGTDGAGIWLERVDASNWRFVTYDTARNNGSSFAKVSDGTYFNITIEFTDDPSNRAIGKIDGVDKTAGGLTTQLPTAKQMHVLFGSFAGATRDMEIDRVTELSGALIDLT